MERDAGSMLFARMPRYYFNVRNHLDSDDPEGVELEDDAAACAYAVDSARDLACVSIKEEGSLNLDHRIEVADGSGRLVFAARFGDSFKIIG